MKSNTSKNNRRHFSPREAHEAEMLARRTNIEQAIREGRSFLDNEYDSTASEPAEVRAAKRDAFGKELQDEFEGWPAKQRPARVPRTPLPIANVVEFTPDGVNSHIKITAARPRAASTSVNDLLLGPVASTLDRHPVTEAETRFREQLNNELTQDARFTPAQAEAAGRAATGQLADVVKLSHTPANQPDDPSVTYQAHVGEV